MHSRFRFITLGSLISFALASGAGAQDIPQPNAADLDYTLGVQIEHDDNINRSHDDPVSGTILSPQLGFGYRRQGATLSALAAGAVEYDDYIGNTPYSSYLRGVFAGSADWTISPQRLDWLAEDYLGRQPVNVLASETPDNQQQTNVFSTGPTLHARLGQNLRGQFDLRYTNTYADQSREFNSNRLGATGRLSWLLSPVSTLYAAATDLRVRYNASASEPFDYDRNDAYFGYQHASRLFKLDVAAGYTWLDLRAPGNRSGTLVNASVVWTPSSTNDLGLTFKRAYSDASDDLIIAPGDLDTLGVGSARNGAVISPQLYVEKLARLDFNHSQDRLHFNLAPFWRHIDYFEGNLLSQRSRGYYAQLSWLLRPSLSLVASTGLEHRHYTAIERHDDDTAYGLGLIWQHSRHWLLSLRASHLTRDSEPAVFGYSDNAIILALTYKR